MAPTNRKVKDRSKNMENKVWHYFLPAKTGFFLWHSHAWTWELQMDSSLCL